MWAILFFSPFITNVYMYIELDQFINIRSLSNQAWLLAAVGKRMIYSSPCSNTRCPKKLYLILRAVHLALTKLLALLDSKNMYKSFGTWSDCIHTLTNYWQDISKSQVFTKLVFCVILWLQTLSDLLLLPEWDALHTTKYISVCKRHQIITFTLIEG